MPGELEWSVSQSELCEDSFSHITDNVLISVTCLFFPLVCLIKTYPQTQLNVSTSDFRSSLPVPKILTEMSGFLVPRSDSSSHCDYYQLVNVSESKTERKKSWLFVKE